MAAADKPPEKPAAFPLRRYAARERAGKILRWVLAIAGAVQLVRYLKPAVTQAPPGARAPR